MKIAFINQPTDAAILPVQSGSIAIWTHQVACRLAKSCDVVVYARKSKNQEPVEYDEGVQYRRISVDLDKILRGILKLSLRFNNFKGAYFVSIWYHLGYGFKIAKDLREQQCDIVHIQQFSQFVPIIRALNPKIKIVLHMHGDGFSSFNQKMIERRLQQVNLVLTCSDNVAKNNCRKFLSFYRLFHTIYNGVDTSKFREANRVNQEKNNLLFVGRVSPEKGVHVLLEAFKKVNEFYPDTQLTIVGPQISAPLEIAFFFKSESSVEDLASFYSESYMSYLRDRIPSHLKNQVIFTGHVPHSKLLDFYQKADILILPSVCDEAFGMPIAEAMATGLPVIASRAGGIPEVVKEGQTGLLVEPGNSTALAEAIVRLLSDEKLRKSMGRAGRQRAVELFSWEQIVDNLLSHYKNICN